jgi:hypothetical protein
MSDTDPTRFEFRARIDFLESQLASVTAHRDRLRIYEKQWKEHEAITRAYTMHDTLRITMTINTNGMCNMRDCVISLPDLRQNILGPSIIGQRVISYYNAMVQAIQQAKAAEEKK